MSIAAKCTCGKNISGICYGDCPNANPGMNKAQDPSIYAHKIVTKNSKGADQWRKPDKVQEALKLIEEQVNTSIQIEYPNINDVYSWMSVYKDPLSGQNKQSLVRAAAILTRLIASME